MLAATTDGFASRRASPYMELEHTVHWVFATDSGVLRKRFDIRSGAASSQSAGSSLQGRGRLGP